MKFVSALLLVLFVASCSTQSDSEILVGKWKFYRMKKGKEILLSSDRAEEKKIVDGFVKKNAHLFESTNMTETKFREQVMLEMSNMLNVYFEFKKDSTVVVENNHPAASSIENWKYTVNEEKKELEVKETSRTIIYKYTLEENLLTLKKGKEEITFERFVELPKKK